MFLYSKMVIFYALKKNIAISFSTKFISPNVDDGVKMFLCCLFLEFHEVLEIIDSVGFLRSFIL